MCKCTPSIRTPFCGAEGCRAEDLSNKANPVNDDKIITEAKDLMKYKIGTLGFESASKAVFKAIWQKYNPVSNYQDFYKALYNFEQGMEDHDDRCTILKVMRTLR